MNGANTVITVRRATRIRRLSVVRDDFPTRTHSRYQRRVADLPLAGRAGPAPRGGAPFSLRWPFLCGRQIFTERFDRRRFGAIGAAHGTAGLYRPSPWAGAGRQAGGDLSPRRLMLPVSNDTLLRVVRRRELAFRQTRRRVDRHRRLGLATESALRHHHLRSGTAAGREASCRIGSRRPRRLGLLVIQPLKSSLAIAAVATAKRRLRLCHMPSRSPIAGISWRTPAGPSLTPFVNRCVRSAARSAQQRSIPSCSPPPSASNMRATFAARRPTRPSWH